MIPELADKLKQIGKYGDYQTAVAKGDGNVASLLNAIFLMKAEAEIKSKENRQPNSKSSLSEIGFSQSKPPPGLFNVNNNPEKPTGSLKKKSFGECFTNTLIKQGIFVDPKLESKNKDNVP